MFLWATLNGIDRTDGCATLAQGLTPVAITASSVSFERDRELRIARLRAAARDLVAERRRPSRAKMRALRVAPGGRIEWRSAPRAAAARAEGGDRPPDRRRHL